MYDPARGHPKTPVGMLEAEMVNAVTRNFMSVAGPASCAVVSAIQGSMAEEAVCVQAAAHAAGSDPVNNRPVTYNGKTYTWQIHKGRPVLVPQGARAPSIQGATPQPESGATSSSTKSKFIEELLKSIFQRAGRREGANLKSIGEGPGGQALANAMGGTVDESNLSGLDPAFCEKVVKVLRRLEAKGWKPRVASGRRPIKP